MKNKLLISLLSVACASCLTLGLAACNNNSGNTTGGGNTNGNTNNTYPTYPREEEVEGETNLDYELNEEEGTYTITGIGTEKGTVVKIPATIDGLPVTKIAADAFSGKTNITAVTIADGITEIGNNAFSGCTGIRVITIPSTVVKMGTGVFQSCIGLLNVVFGQGITAIPNGTFQSCIQLSRVIIPENIKKIGERAFQGCVNLKTVEMGSGVETIATRAFYQCTGLTEITVGSGVTAIGDDVFRECTSLKKIVVPNSVRFIGTSFLEGCYSLEILSVPFIGAFRYDDPPEFLLDSDEDEDDSGNVTIGNTIKLDEPTTYAFFGYIFGATSNYDTRKYTSPLFNPSETAGAGHGKLSVIITDDAPIANGAFNEVYGVSTVVITGEITEIMRQGLAFCWNLEKLVIPKTLTTLGDSVFYGDTEWFKTLYYHGTAADWNAFVNGNGITAGSNANPTNPFGNNQPIINATRYYYSENPADKGCWHYDANGLPVLW